MRITFIAILFCLFTLPSFASINYVRVMFHDDASTSATIGWNQKSGEFFMLLYDTASYANNDYLMSATTVKSNRSKGMFNHFIELDNLEPNTRYYFRIKDSEDYSEEYYFTTLPDTPTHRLSFIAGGDSRDGIEVRRKANQMVAKLKPHAVLFNGDFTAFDIEKQWIEWFDDWELSISNGRITPLIVTRGNHELTNATMVNLFNVPHKKVYYSTTCGGDLLHFVSLNSEILKFFGQKKFLRKALKEHQDYTWQIPQYHRPIRPHVAHKKEMETQYKNFVPLFEKYSNVRLCLENDSHTCKTTWPIVSSKAEGSEEGFIRNDTIGIVYIGEGCWGAPLRPADDLKCWTRDAAMINHFNWIFVDQSKIQVRAIKYENVAEVSSLTEKNRFDLPKNINIWDPSNGSVIEIPVRKATLN